MSKYPAIVWFRRDLRLHDNPAWNKALQRGSPVVPLYIHTSNKKIHWQPGSASNWWLHHALSDLDDQLKKSGNRLIIRSNPDILQALQQIIYETDSRTVYWNKCYEPDFVKCDHTIRKTLIESGIHTESFNGSLLHEPLAIKNKSGKPFQIFTPFWKHCRKQEVKTPETVSIKRQTYAIESTSVTSLNLLPSIPWDKGITDFWRPVRAEGIKLLKQASKKSQHYNTQRDIPELDSTSRLSPYLHFGQISPREFFHNIRSNATDKNTADLGILRQLYWREFSAHLLFHFPHSQNHALKSDYDRFPWNPNENHLRAWQQGQTGFPIVDAGMRQLWQTGWMHNRVRMITASFLVKHLLQPWQEGARWFWDTLVDADLPNNTMGWQWIAGSGADASPYFRIFNPIIQGKKFDPHGTYVKHWLPELKHLPKQHIHSPWERTPLELASAGVTLGINYPYPIISHGEGRQQALNAYTHFKQTA